MPAVNTELGLAGGHLTSRSSPAINDVPPHHFCPFLESGFGPFTMSPPVRTKQPEIMRRRHRPLILRKFLPKERKSAGAVPITGNQQHLVRRHSIQTFMYVNGFRNGRVLKVRADTH